MRVHEWATSEDEPEQLIEIQMVAVVDLIHGLAPENFF